MLNPFLLESAQVDPQVRVQRTHDLQRALREGSTEHALTALAWGADPHAASLEGELLMGRALEHHHPRLAAAFLAVGGQFQLVRPEPLGPFWLRAFKEGTRSRVYDPADRAASGVLATFSDFQAIAWRMQASHARTWDEHRACPDRLAMSDPGARWHALLALLELMRKEIYVPGSGFGVRDNPALQGHPVLETDEPLLPVLSGVQ